MGEVARAPRTVPLSRRLCLLSRQRGARLASLLELRDLPGTVISASSQPWAMAVAEQPGWDSPGAHGAGAARRRGGAVAPSSSTCPGWGELLSSAAPGPAGGWLHEGSRARWHDLRGQEVAWGGPLQSPFNPRTPSLCALAVGLPGGTVGTWQPGRIRPRGDLHRDGAAPTLPVPFHAPPPRSPRSRGGDFPSVGAPPPARPGLTPINK